MKRGGELQAMFGQLRDDQPVQPDRQILGLIRSVPELFPESVAMVIAQVDENGAHLCLRRRLEERLKTVLERDRLAGCLNLLPHRFRFHRELVCPLRAERVSKR